MNPVSFVRGFVSIWCPMIIMKRVEEIINAEHGIRFSCSLRAIFSRRVRFGVLHRMLEPALAGNVEYMDILL